MSYVISDTYTYDSSAADSQVLSLGSKNFSSDEEAIKGIVQAYFVLRYEFLKNLTQETFALVAASDDPDAFQWLRRENSRQNIERHNAELFNTKYLDYKFTLDYVGFEIGTSKAVVRLLESHWVRYASTPDFVSHLANMEHVITLKKVGERWLIIMDAYPEDLLYRSLEIATEKEILENIRRNYEMQFLEPADLESEVTPTSEDSVDTMLATYAYSRTAAKNYADSWYSATGPVPSYIRNQPGWNSSWPTLYCRYGSVDCTNFVSQAIFEGTGYTYSQTDYFNPDYTHYMDWWYYKFSSTVDGSYPWVNTGGLYTFLTTNTGRGPYGSLTTLCGLSQGDIVFMKNVSDGWQHAVIISAITGDCINPANIIVDSHNPDMRGPLIDPQFTKHTWYPVTISGYRK